MEIFNANVQWIDWLFPQVFFQGQFGFRCGHSSTYAVHHHRIHTAIENKIFLRGIFLNLTKAHLTLYIMVF